MTGRRQNTVRAVRAAVSVVTAAALVAGAALLSGGAAAAAAFGTGSGMVALTAVPESTPFSVPDGSVPAVDSEIGFGSALGTSPDATLDLSRSLVGTGLDTADGAALVRLSVLSPATDVVVWAGADTESGAAPVLSTAAGRSSSTAVLLPVAAGRVGVHASAEVQLRAEVLAVFPVTTGGTEGNAGVVAPAPGATTALPNPVTRADTAHGLAATTLGSEPVAIGLVGDGGVPADDVRAVYATATVTTPTATTLVLDAQSIPLAAGTTSVTTIITPDGDGRTFAHLTAGEASLRLDVRGWVADAADDTARANVAGGYVPAADTAPVSLTLGGAHDSSAEVQLAQVDDAAYSVALVSATGAGETTLMQLGAPYEGRARGVVVDGDGGAQPQLVVAPVAQGDGAVAAGTAALELRRGAGAATVAPLGDILGAAPARASGDLPAITLDSHDDHDTVDLGMHGSVELSGVVDPQGASVDRVEVSGPDGLIGTADLTVGEDERLTWSYRVSAPRDGDHRYTATVFDRAGESDSDDVLLAVQAVDADDTVIAPDVTVAGGGSSGLLTPQAGVLQVTEGPEVAESTEEEAWFDADPGVSPGDVIVSGTTEGAPEGVFVEVTAVDRVGSRWRVATVPAKIDQVFLQVDTSVAVQPDDPAGVVVDDTPAPDAESTPVDEVVDEGYSAAEVLEGDEVDLADFAEQPSEPLSDPAYDAPGVEDPDDYGHVADPAGAGDAVAAFAASAAAAEPDPDDVGPSDFGLSMRSSVNLKATYDRETKSPRLTDLTAASSDPQKLLDTQFREMTRVNETGLVLSATAQVGFELTFTLRTHLTYSWFAVHVVVDELTMKIETKVKVTASAKIFISSTLEHAIRNKIAGFTLPTFTVPVGPVPVVITNEVGVAVKIAMAWQAAASLPSIGFTRVDVSGFTYSTEAGTRSLSKAPAITTTPLLPQKLDDVEFKLSGDFSVGPEVTVTSKIYGVAGPEFALSGMAALSGSVSNVGSVVGLDLSFGLVVTFGGRLQVKIFSWSLADLELFTIAAKFPLFVKHWDLVDLGTSPPQSPTPTPSPSPAPSG
ncbi:hypothetical protein N1031_18985 [Herbiconiux moechotypicola]|uniref:Bacterial Ig-like domain-containing protein n=1 Tax=Herbiconiux moechotypicola TaxID=637393 RepID=A0ABP5R3D3_9MICO|nr:hypothetical protein [Herbiconiux moechotypicola]MCS5731846.1 hypothetical protein [Herbiconiux moechotypicola]